MKHISTFNSFLNEGIGVSTTPDIGQFSENRMQGASDIANNAAEKGGDALLTYHHFHVKLPYYEKAMQGKFNMEDASTEYKSLLEELYAATSSSMDIEQVAFQELVGKLEVLGELLIKEKN